MQQEESEDGNDSIWLPTVFQHLELAQALYDKNLKKAIKAIDEINEYGFQISHEK